MVNACGSVRSMIEEHSETWMRGSMTYVGQCGAWLCGVGGIIENS